MDSRTVDPGCASAGTQNPLEAVSGHNCINMVKATKVVTRVKDYDSSQPELGKELDPSESSLQIENPTDKPKDLPCVPKGVLKNLGHNTNA